MLKFNLTLKLVVGLATGFASSLLSANGAEWQSFVLSGTFTSSKADATDMVLITAERGHLLFKNYARGLGLTSYSLSMGKPVEDNSGNLILLVDFTAASGTAADFSLSGEKIVDLGALAAPPAKIKLPKNGLFSHPYTGFRKMVAGNYYYIAQSGRHFVIQPISFEVSKVQVTDQSPGLFGYTIHSADCALKARFLSASTIDGLQQAIKSLSAPGAQTNAALELRPSAGCAKRSG